MGAPALATKMEQLIEMGAKRFIAIGLAGSLVEGHKIGDFAVSTKALAEDGVSHLYLPEGVSFLEPMSFGRAVGLDSPKLRGCQPFTIYPTGAFQRFFAKLLAL